MKFILKFKKSTSYLFNLKIHPAAAAAAKSLQSCPTLCDPIDGSPPGSLIPGILQARTLEWVDISFSNAWKWKVKVKLLSRVWLFMTPWITAYQGPLSMGFSRQEYWSGLPIGFSGKYLQWQLNSPQKKFFYKRRISLEFSGDHQLSSLKHEASLNICNIFQWLVFFNIWDISL